MTDLFPSNMILICDTRQKKGQHLNIERYCSEHNITMIPQCLNVGDYMLENGTIAVDTKQTIDELAHDLFRDKCAFYKKYKKCYKNGIKLIVLIEERISCVENILKWKSQHSKITGQFLVEMINDVKVSYGVEFYFCDKKDTGRYLIKLLKSEK